MIDEKIAEYDSKMDRWSSEYHPGSRLMPRIEMMEEMKCSCDELEAFCRQYWNNRGIRRGYAKACADRCDTDGENGHAETQPVDGRRLCRPGVGLQFTNVIYGTTGFQKSDYDKPETVVITLNPEGLESGNDLIRYLSLLLNRKMPLKERQEKLVRDYHIQMTEEMKENVGNVCNYSDAILRIGKEEGFAEGFAKGIAIGIAIGIAEGKAKGESLLAALVIKLKELGRTDDVFRAAADKEYRERLYKEFQLA